jgi:hypothetical protein
MGEPDSDLALLPAVLAGQRQPFGHRPSRRPMLPSTAKLLLLRAFAWAEEYPDVDIGYMPT